MTLKLRSCPYQTFTATVAKIAVAAEAGEAQSTISVTCHFSESSSSALRPGMTGYARVHTGRRMIGQTVLDPVVRNVRTEFWW